MSSSGMFKAGRQTQLAITYTCLSAFVLFGYDQGVFAGLITNPDFLETFHHPNAGLLGIIVSCYNLGCCTGCVLNFYLGPRFGRRFAIRVAMSFVSVGAILQASSSSIPQLMVGRIITGVGVGIDTSTVPMYQAELCKREHRGRLVSSEVLFTAVGVSFAYFFDYGLSFVRGSVAWRLPIACQIPMALSVMILVTGLPETPRFLMHKGQVDDGVAVMCKVWDTAKNDPYVQNEKKEILKAISLEKSTHFKWSRIFQQDAVQTGWRIFLACLALFMNQWAGINVIVFYAPTVLETSVGLSRNTAIVVGGTLNLAFAAGSLVPALGADRLGRRIPMILGAIGMGVCMMMIAILLSFQGTPNGHVCAQASIAFFLLYMLIFGGSLNATPWLYCPEILPLNIRAQGTAIAVFNSWIWVFVIVMITPIIVANLAWKSYLIFMCMNFAFVPMIYFWFPETKNLSLEEIDYLFLKRVDELALSSFNNAEVSDGRNADHKPLSNENDVMRIENAHDGVDYKA